MKTPLRLILILLLVVPFGCKKIIEKKKESMMMDAITNGQWIVEQYFENTTNLSGDFLHYEFQFYKDYSVKSTKEGNAVSGTWQPDTEHMTIVADFPSAVDPLKKFNGLWKIKDSEWTYVKAEMITDSGKKTLHLRKKA